MIRGHVIAAGLRQHGGALGKKLRQYKGIGGPCDLKRFQESPLRNVSLGWIQRDRENAEEFGVPKHSDFEQNYFLAKGNGKPP